MTLLQEFYPMPVDENLLRDNSTNLSLNSVLVWNGWQLRALSIADINRGYVLAPTPFAREIVDYVIRNKEQIQQVQKRYLYFLRIDNTSQLWPPPVDLPENLTAIVPLPRLYGKLIAESVATHNLKSLGARSYNFPTNQNAGTGLTGTDPNNQRQNIFTDTSTILADYPIQFYGVGGIIDTTVPVSSRYGIPKHDTPFVTAFGNNSDEVIIDPFLSPVLAQNAVYTQYDRGNPPRSSTFRNGVRVGSTGDIPFPSREIAVNRWFNIVNENFAPSTDDHILLLFLASVWQNKPNVPKDLQVPFRFCPILRIRLGDVETQYYLGDLGYYRSVSASSSPRSNNLGYFSWPMVLPASTGSQRFTVDVWFPEIFENNSDIPNIITSIARFVYSLRSSKSLIKESLLWKDLTVWPQGPPTANILGTPVRVPKGSTYKGNDRLITIPDGWTLSDGFDYLRTSDSVWIAIDILLRSGIPMSDIDFTSAVTASRSLESFVGVIVNDVLSVLDELPIRPRFTNGLWRFGSNKIITLSLDVIQRLPQISITRPTTPVRIVGVPYKPMKFVQVIRESNPEGYHTIHVVDTNDEEEAIKEGRRYLWPEITYTLQVVLSNSINILVNDYVVTPESNRQWKVESIKRTSNAQEITASWIDPRRENYIETGSEDPISDDFIDEWGFLDEHGFIFD